MVDQSQVAVFGSRVQTSLPPPNPPPGSQSQFGQSNVLGGTTPLQEVGGTRLGGSIGQSQVSNFGGSEQAAAQAQSQAAQTQSLITGSQSSSLANYLASQNAASVNAANIAALSNIKVLGGGGVQIGNTNYVGDTYIPELGLTANQYAQLIKKQAIGKTDSSGNVIKPSDINYYDYTTTSSPDNVSSSLNLPKQSVIQKPIQSQSLVPQPSFLNRVEQAAIKEIPVSVRNAYSLYTNPVVQNFLVDTSGITRLNAENEIKREYASQGISIDTTSPAFKQAVQNKVNQISLLQTFGNPTAGGLIAPETAIPSAKNIVTLSVQKELSGGKIGTVTGFATTTGGISGRLQAISTKIEPDLIQTDAIGVKGLEGSVPTKSGFFAGGSLSKTAETMGENVLYDENGIRVTQPTKFGGSAGLGRVQTSKGTEDFIYKALSVGGKNKFLAGGLKSGEGFAGFSFQAPEIPTSDTLGVIKPNPNIIRTPLSDTFQEQVAIQTQAEKSANALALKSVQPTQLEKSVYLGSRILPTTELVKATSQIPIIKPSLTGDTIESFTVPQSQISKINQNNAFSQLSTEWIGQPQNISQGQVSVSKNNQLESSTSALSTSAAQNEVQRLASPQSLTQKEIQQSKEQFVEPTIFQPFNVTPLTPLAFPVTILDNNKKKGLLKGKIGKFLAESKRHGKIVKVAETFTPEEAFSKAETFARKNLARSVIVINESTGQRVRPSFIPSDFRPSKNRKTPEILIQSNALSSRSETTEIQSAKRQSNRFKPIKMKKSRRRI